MCILHRNVPQLGWGTLHYGMSCKKGDFCVAWPSLGGWERSIINIKGVAFF